APLALLHGAYEAFHARQRAVYRPFLIAVLPRTAQGDMEGGAPFRVVDRRAGEQALDGGRHVSPAREGEQQVERLLGDEVLRIVEQEAGGVHAETAEAVGIGAEQAGERELVLRAAVPVQGLPLGRLVDGGEGVG